MNAGRRCCVFPGSTAGDWRQAKGYACRLLHLDQRHIHTSLGVPQQPGYLMKEDGQVICTRLQASESLMVSGCTKRNACSGSAQVRCGATGRKASLPAHLPALPQPPLARWAQ